MSATSNNLATCRYYRANEGCWRAPLDLRIINWAAWWRADLGLFLRIGTLAVTTLARLPRLLTLQTRVVCETAEVELPTVIHETWIRVLGLVVMASIERFELAADGKRATIVGEQRYAPLWWMVWPYCNSHLEVADDAKSARYQFEVATLRWQQRANIEGENVRLVMQNEWLLGENRLVRRRC